MWCRSSRVSLNKNADFLIDRFLWLNFNIWTFWRNKHLESHQILFWSGDGSRTQRRLCDLERTSRFCSADCWLELEGNWTLPHERNVTERRQSTRTSTRTRVKHTDTCNLTWQTSFILVFRISSSATGDQMKLLPRGNLWISLVWTLLDYLWWCKNTTQQKCITEIKAEVSHITQCLWLNISNNPSRFLSTMPSDFNLHPSIFQ